MSGQLVVQFTIPCHRRGIKVRGWGGCLRGTSPTGGREICSGRSSYQRAVSLRGTVTVDDGPRLCPSQVQTPSLIRDVFPGIFPLYIESLGRGPSLCVIHHSFVRRSGKGVFIPAALMRDRVIWIVWIGVRKGIQDGCIFTRMEPKTTHVSCLGSLLLIYPITLVA